MTDQPTGSSDPREPTPQDASGQQPQWQQPPDQGASQGWGQPDPGYAAPAYGAQPASEGYTAPGGYAQPQGYPYAAGPTAPFGPNADPAAETKGFFGALFDFSFSRYITPTIVKFVFLLATVVIAIGFLAGVVSAFQASAIAGFLFLLIVGPVFAIFYLALIRVSLEVMIAVVRMSTDIREWKERGYQ